MGKNCVQHVRTRLDNRVEDYPQLPHPKGINSHQSLLTHILTHRPTALSRRLSKPPYTGKFNIPTERKRLLSTLSTHPITTTTTYI